MRIDDQPIAPVESTSVGVHGPAQQSISEFLAVHRTLPPRSRLDRIFGRSPLVQSSASWYWTAVGQLRMAAALDRIGADWRVFHGVPGPADARSGEPTWIDHLVVGPLGVFTVTAYDHSKQNVWVGRRAFIVDGHRLQYLRTAEAEVGHVERMLGSATGGTVTAGAIIAVIDPGSLQVRDLPRDVFVVSSSRLIAVLRAGNRRLPADRVQVIASAIARAGTWPGEAPSDSELIAAAREHAQFTRIRREVVTARAVRTLWAVGAASLLTAVLVAVGILQLLSLRTVTL